MKQLTPRVGAQVYHTIIMQELFVSSVGLEKVRLSHGLKLRFEIIPVSTSHTNIMVDYAFEHRQTEVLVGRVDLRRFTSHSHRL